MLVCFLIGDTKAVVLNMRGDGLGLGGIEEGKVSSEYSVHKILFSIKENKKRGDREY